MLSVAIVLVGLAPRTSRADGPSSSTSSDEVPCPTPRYRAGQPVPSGYVVDSSPDTALLVTGLTTLWFTYGATAIAAADLPLDRYAPQDDLARHDGHKVESAALGWLALPGAGPFLTAAALPKLDPKGPIDDRSLRAVLVADGIAQTASIGLVALSFALSHPTLSPIRGKGGPPRCARPAGGEPPPGPAMPLAMGGLFLVIFHPLAEIFAVEQSRDRARLWALLPGPGPIIAAAKLHEGAPMDRKGDHARALYGILGATEMSALVFMATAPLWPSGSPRVRAALPEVGVGAGTASLTWRF